MKVFALNEKTRRYISYTLLMIFVGDVITPTAAMALTSGPSQPEVQSFTPLSNTDMVDLFSGDFKYNIPLLDVEGYPLNLAYSGGITTDQEATWVGLGWNLNVGSISRSMRGLPDDFNGDKIVKQQKTKENRTFGINGTAAFEILGKETKEKPGAKKGKSLTLKKPTVGVGINYNNYNGFGMEYSVASGISAGDPAKSKLNLDLGLKSDANSGLDISPNISFSSRREKLDENDNTLTHVNNGSGALGGKFNSRAGLKELSFSGAFAKSTERAAANAGDEVEVTPGKSKSGKGCVNFGLQTYVPSSSWDMKNTSVSLAVKFGAQLFGADANVELRGYYSCQKMKDNLKESSSYGYMYTQSAINNDHALLDFNREKDGSYSRTTKNLPLTSFTYDVFNISGEGIGGAFRPFRSDIGHVWDVPTLTETDDWSIGAELSGGNLIKVGGDVAVIDVNSTTGKWKKNNGALSFFSFHGNTVAASDFEPYYFKRVGEQNYNSSNMTLYHNTGKDKAYGIRIKQGGNNTAGPVNSNMPNIEAKAELEESLYNNDPLSEILLQGVSNKLNGRGKRNQYLNILTRAEAATGGLQKDLYNATGVIGLAPSSPAMKAYNVTTGSIGHHIAEISVVSPDGERHFYGLPAYNKVNVEASFNISGNSIDPLTGFVNYNGTDASLSNNKGTDNYFSKNEIPPYAHSYLLTAVVSADYADLNGNGPDDEDVGTYTKFHYQKVGAGSGDYKWRMPVAATDYRANFTENSKSNTQDNMGNYSYGEKEVWFLDEIETKNYVAVFVLADRADAKGVQNEQGQPNGLAQKRLDKIMLYLKKDYKNSPSGAAVPVKTVHFTYSYELCQGLPNNDGSTDAAITTNQGGKLTLKSIYFTYGKSNRAALNKYQFSYSAVNPIYNNKAYDRWGNYKPAGPINYAHTAAPTNPEFPYVEQDKVNADLNASAWSLNKITLPSGGEIDINYESDDYAFVQNVPAGQMFKVVGTHSGAAPQHGFALPGSSDLYSSTGSNKSFLIVDIGSLADISDQEFVKYYLKDINENNKKMFFKFLINLTKNGATNQNIFEYVSGYADLESVSGVAMGGLVRTLGGAPTGKAWIKVKDVSLKNAGNGPWANPIAMTAIQFARNSFGSVVWGANYNPPGDVEEALKQLAQAATSSLKPFINGFKNPNKALADQGFCKEFIPSKSMVRLYNPDGKRLGGGSRVKSVSIKDNWDVMTATGGFSQDATQYEQTYTYETTEAGRTISSGVASYEPMIGSEENSMKQPHYLGQNKWAFLAPDDRYYVEGPFGESFFPTPSVGYSKVTVRSKIPATATNITNSGKNGYKVHEFYTAKDYPTITRQTPIMPKQFRSPLRTLVKIAQTDLVYASQGYAIVTNDMHGKVKKESDYSEGKTELDGPEKSITYYYKTLGGYQTPSQKGLHTDASYSTNELDNICKVVEKDAKVTDKTIGVDFDAIADFREAETETRMISTQYNVATFLAGVIPIVVPTVWPSMQYELARFRSAVFTKVVNRYGILDRTVVRDGSSSVTTENVAFDAETGNTVLTKSTNNFNDPVFTVNYPAHWGYDFMGAAYKRCGFTAKSIQGTSPAGVIYLTPPTIPVGEPAAFALGDEVLLKSGSNYEKAWITEIQTGGQYLGLKLSDASGNPSTLAGQSEVTIKVIRSARRNLLNSNMASVVCLKNPIVPNGQSIDYLNVDAASKVLDAKGVSYSDDWHMVLGLSHIGGCDCELDGLNSSNSILNEFWGLLQCLWNGDIYGSTSNVTTTNQFFNGAGAQTTGLQNNSTVLYRDPNVNFGCPSGSPVCNYPTGYFNPGFSSVLLNEMAATTACNFGTHAYAYWNGPPQTNNPASIFVGDKIIGTLGTCVSTYPITIDFTHPSFGPSQKSQLCNYIPTLKSGVNPNVNGNWFTLSVNGVSQNDCNRNEMAFNFNIWSGFPYQILHSYPVKISTPFLDQKVVVNCQSPNGPISYVCGNLPGQKVNPFAQGIKGNWRTKAKYSYLSDRVQTLSSAANGKNTDTRSDGHYSAYTPLYAAASGSDWTFSAGSGVNKWVSTSEVTKYNQSGVEIETKDAMGRYSSAMYGYNESLPVAVAANAQLREIGFDGFEDYGYYNTNCNREPHFAFQTAVYLNQATLNSEHKHSGKFSLRVENGKTASLSKMVTSTPQQAQSGTPNYFSYLIGDADFIYPFYPVTSGSTNRNYLVTYWVKESGNGTYSTDYVNANVTVTQGAGPAFAISNLKKSLIIDGWQRVEFNLTIPFGYNGPLRINLANTSSSSSLKVYFDDFRIHPANSKMKSYVYHPTTLKYMAELDENNYATFYEYDDQGNLTRVKKETERGTMTLKESKTHYAN